MSRLAGAAGLLLLLIQHYSHPSQAAPTQQEDSESPNSWSTFPSLSLGPRQEHSVVSTNDAIWVLGGTIPGGETVSSIEFFNLADQTWHSTATPFLQPLNHLNAAVVADKIYILSGLAPRDSSWDAQDLNMVYSPTEEDSSWTPLAASPPGTARGACAVGVYGTKIYLAGGMTYLNSAQDVVDTVTVYDTASDSWEMLPALPQPRQHVAGVVIGSKFYVLGGRTDGQLKIQNTVFVLDVENVGDGWKEMASMPTARGGLACAGVKELIYCLGGEGNQQNESGVFGQVEVFDTATNAWTSLAEMPVPRHGWGVTAVGDTIYVPGGGVKAGTAPTDYFDAFTP